MDSQAKHGFKDFKLSRFGRRDRQVTPAEDGGRDLEGQTNANRKNESSLKTISKQVDDKKTERENKRIRKEEIDRMRNIELEHKLLKRRRRKEVRKDLSDTSFETCATFCFILIVGSTLLGGGAALIVSGKENNVFDFIVVGGSGITIGVIFTVAGIILIIKPVYEKHQARKQSEREEVITWGKKNVQPKDQRPTYLDETRKNVLTSEIGDTRLQERRPSNVELYGDESFDNCPAMATPRDESFHSYVEPPLLAVPNNERQSSKNKPVLLLDSKEEPVSPVKNSAKYSSTPNPNIGVPVSPVNYSAQQSSPNVSVLVGLTSEDKKIETENTQTQSQQNDIDIEKITEIHIKRNVSKNTVVIEHFVSDVDKSPVQNETSAADTEQAQSHGMKDLEKLYRTLSFSSGITVPLDDSSSDLELSDSPKPHRLLLRDVRGTEV